MSPSKPASNAETAFLGLGSNLGDRAGTIRRALREIGRLPGTRLDAVSSLYETLPVGPPQPPYVNAVARVTTRLDPRELLAACLDVEARFGRVRAERWGPRTLDIDLLLFGEREIDEPGLAVPHPRMTGRAFVLVPLAELDPERLVAGRRAAEWAAAAGTLGVRRLATVGRAGSG